jgi:hypothetical protein
MRADNNGDEFEVKMIVNSARILTLILSRPSVTLVAAITPEQPRHPMDLVTLFDEMSGYDDFWDYNIGGMPILGAGSQAQVYRMPDEDDFVLRVSNGDGWFEYARMILEDTTGLPDELKAHLPVVRELAHRDGAFFGVVERLRPIKWDTPMDLWRHTAIRCGIEHRLEGDDLRRFRSDRRRLSKEMPHFVGFLDAIKARHDAMCDCNFPNWMERESDGLLVWSDPIAHMTDAEILDFVDRYDYAPSPRYAAA